MVSRYVRNINDYLKNIGDRVEFTDEYGETMRGKITGMGAAGGYIEVQGDDGQRHSGNSSEFTKLFDD